MKDVNKMILIGRLGADPIQRETKNGFPVTSFSLATSRRVKQEGDGEGSWTGEETEWHRVVVWGKQAGICRQYLRKGSHIFVEGMVRSHKYDSKDGISRIAFEVHADNVVFLSPRSTEEPAPEAHTVPSSLTG